MTPSSRLEGDGEEEVPESHRRPITRLPLYPLHRPKRDWDKAGSRDLQDLQWELEGTVEGAASQYGPDDKCATEFNEDEAASQVFSRDQRRSRRKRDVRPRTINTARLAKRTLEEGRLSQPELEVTRPRTRADCAAAPRPCPFVSCRYHLYLDVSPRTGAIKLNFPDLEVWELHQTCALDVAEEGPVGAEELGLVMNLTRERIRQLQKTGLASALGQLDSP